MAAQSSRSAWAAVACLLAVCLAGSTHLVDAQTYDTPLAAVADANNLNTLATLLDSAGLLSVFNTSTLNATVFAPTNAAFRDALAALNLTAEQLTADNATLNALLQYHVVPVALNSTEIAALPGSTVITNTLNGALLRVSAEEDNVVVNATGSDAVVTQADIEGGDTVIHIIDNVLLPFYQSVASAAVRTNLSILLAALDAADLGDTFADTNLIATVFAPTNQAFQNALTTLGLTADQLFDNDNSELLTNILLNHVVLGQALNSSQLTDGMVVYPALANSTLTARKPNDTTVQVQALGSTATVVQADLNVALNRAIIHVVDTVLLPFYPTIAAAVMDTESLSTLEAAVTAAGLGSTLSNGSLIATVFAPNNDAFNNALDNLDVSEDGLLSQTGPLTTLLNYHIITGDAINSSEITDGQRLTTAGGLILNATVNSSGVYLMAENSTAKVVQADIMIGADRSVVHIIDAVLLPNNGTLNVTGAAGFAKPSLMMMLGAVMGAAGLMLMAF